MSIFGIEPQKLIAIITATIFSSWFLQAAVKEIVSTITRHKTEKWMASGGSLRGRHLRRYRKAIAERDNRHPLGFLQSDSIYVDRLFVPLQHEVHNSTDGKVQRIDIGPTLIEGNRLV